MEYSSHYSVLKNESIDYVVANLDKDKYLVMDGTFGGGGHSFSLLEKDPRVHVLAFDQDPDAIANGKKRIENSEFKDRIYLYHSNFDQVTKVFEQFKNEHPEFTGLDGAILDLGVSSHHFDKKERGFSFRGEADLDMRMDYQNEEHETAADVLNTYSVEDLTEIFQKYGEERFSKRIAGAVAEERSKAPLKKTKELENIIFHCYPKKMRFGKSHPATRCFQALRIHVNRELQVLEDVLKSLPNLLNEKGRIAIITFHSLEDRIVKHTFRNLGKEIEDLHVLTKKPILPSENEISENSRSRSAKLRVLERSRRSGDAWGSSGASRSRMRRERNSQYEGRKKKNYRKD